MERVDLTIPRKKGPFFLRKLKLAETLGEKYAQRFVSAEKLASDFRSRRVATEIAAFARAGEMSRSIAERAFSKFL